MRRAAVFAVAVLLALPAATQAKTSSGKIEAPYERASVCAIVLPVVVEDGTGQCEDSEPTRRSGVVGHGLLFTWGQSMSIVWGFSSIGATLKVSHAGTLKVTPAWTTLVHQGSTELCLLVSASSSSGRDTCGSPPGPVSIYVATPGTISILIGGFAARFAPLIPGTQYAEGVELQQLNSLAWTLTY